MIDDITYNISKLDSVRTSVELNSRYIEEIVNDIVNKRTEELDSLIKSIKDVLYSPDPLDTEEAKSIALKLPVYLYSVVSFLEGVGIRADASKLIEKTKYNNLILSISGTVKDREHTADIETVEESVVSIACNRAYKTIQSKVQVALELLASIKKILSVGLEEYKISER